jgi:hypothetical protein
MVINSIFSVPQIAQEVVRYPSVDGHPVVALASNMRLMGVISVQRRNILSKAET